MTNASSFDFRHKKTGNLYVMLSQAIDCTNSRDGTPVVVYAPKGDMARVYVRDAAEFAEKFELVAAHIGGSEMTPLDAMRQALEALEGSWVLEHLRDFRAENKAAADLRTAIGEMEKAEPRTVIEECEGRCCRRKERKNDHKQPRRQRSG